MTGTGFLFDFFCPRDGKAMLQATREDFGFETLACRFATEVFGTLHDASPTCALSTRDFDRSTLGLSRGDAK